MRIKLATQEQIDGLTSNIEKTEVQLKEEIKTQINKIPPINDATETKQGLVKINKAEDEEAPHTVPTTGKLEEDMSALKEEIDTSVDTKIDTTKTELSTQTGELNNKVEGVKASLKRLEDAILTDITGNPYEVSFADLQGLVVTGYWNKEKERLEV